MMDMDKQLLLSVENVEGQTRAYLNDARDAEVSGRARKKKAVFPPYVAPQEAQAEILWLRACLEWAEAAVCGLCV